MTHEYDPERFGQVIATLEAQNRVLAGMRDDIVRLFSLVHEIQNKQNEACRLAAQPPEPKRDYIEIIVSAIMGAVAYFILAHFIEK